MGGNGVGLRLLSCGSCLFACFVAICIVHCEATKVSWEAKVRSPSTVKLSRKFYLFDSHMPMDSSNADPYVSSPFSLPPFDSLAPNPLPENTPPYCIYPPFIPQPPSVIPSPTGSNTPTSPPASPVPTLPGPTTPGPPGPPIINPNPPTTGPSPTTPTLSPPYYEPNPPYYEPSPPSFEPSPPYNTPSPSGSIPSPRFLPPIVFPPPAVPPPPHRAPALAQWCVAKASVPDPIIQEAMNYACGSGADCDQIQPSGSCFKPNTLFAHASYAFNSYWQRTRVTGGTCDFGGTAILVTVDPSYDGCHFING